MFCCCVFLLTVCVVCSNCPSLPVALYREKHGFQHTICSVWGIFVLGQDPAGRLWALLCPAASSDLYPVLHSTSHFDASKYTHGVNTPHTLANPTANRAVWLACVGRLTFPVRVCL